MSYLKSLTLKTKEFLKIKNKETNKTSVSVCMCLPVCLLIHMCLGAYVGVRRPLLGVCSLLQSWVLGIKFRCSDLVARSFTYWVVSLTPKTPLKCKVLNIKHFVVMERLYK